MYFPVSGVNVNPLIPFLTAFGVSFLTSMGGVSGAFLLLPFQVSVLGYTTPSVSATNHVFNVVAIPSGVYRYVQEGRMLWPLTLIVIIGTLPGVFIGSWIRIEYLPDPEAFKLFAGFVLCYIGYRLMCDLLKAEKECNLKMVNTGELTPRVKVLNSSLKQVEFDFNDRVYSFPPLLVYSICFFVGIVGGIYGIGGGAIIAPFFVAIIGLPVYAVAGAALMGTFVTSVAGVIFYHFLAQFYTDMSVSPDWLLGALFGAGGILGVYLGARTQKYMPAKAIKAILCACVLFVGGKYIVGFFI